MAVACDDEAGLGARIGAIGGRGGMGGVDHGDRGPAQGDGAALVKAGGVVSHNVTELEIECLPKNLPEYIEVDVAELELGHAIHLSQLTLPEGVEMVLHGELDEAHDQPVVSINEPKKVVEEEPVEAADDAADDAAPEAAADDAEKGEDAGE